MLLILLALRAFWDIINNFKYENRDDKINITKLECAEIYLSLCFYIVRDFMCQRM